MRFFKKKLILVCIQTEASSGRARATAPFFCFMGEKEYRGDEDSLER